jgi:biopolymer transport protein ExbB
MSFAATLMRGDAVSTLVSVVLLGMSVGTWVVIVWKAWMLRRVFTDVAQSTAAFWQSSSVDDARARLELFDREGLLRPMLALTQPQLAGTLAATVERSQQLTRVLRDALQLAVNRLQAGQVLLATVGATAPFVGLLGTVWGIYHALMGIASAGQISIDKISGPVGESLIMTAAGLAVAIPAVLGYNILGRFIHRVEVSLEGFAHDLRELMLATAIADEPPAALSTR